MGLLCSLSMLNCNLPLRELSAFNPLRRPVITVSLWLDDGDQNENLLILD